ncbi:MAG: hypothetical protein GX889_06535 [Clostridiales bacterium]|jgi:hypothetical protein|nr:hypothetical protein [Clostridiales bacterium]
MDSGIKYRCVQCKEEELIPKEVVEYFDKIDQSNINEPPSFSCEKCGGIMRPVNYRGVYGKTYKL